MTLHGETRARLVTYSKNNCPQCSEWLLAPDWSEHLNDRCVRHTWSCEACGYQFETAVYFPAMQRTRAA
jgi:ribosomal protein L37AE/L43A